MNRQKNIVRRDASGRFMSTRIVPGRNYNWERTGTVVRARKVCSNQVILVSQKSSLWGLARPSELTPVNS